MEPSIPYLSENTLAGLGITTAEVIDVVEEFIRAGADQSVMTAPKSTIKPADGRDMMSTLAFAKDPPLLVTKSLVLNPRNPERGLPLINGLVTMLDGETGLPLAIMDCNWITAVRTAGLSAVAAKHMARPDASVAAFVGCGVQAKSHLKTFSDAFPLKEVLLLGRGRANIDAMCQLADDLGLTSRVCDSGQSVLTGADLVVSTVPVTAQIEPFLDPHLLPEGSFATITDQGVPWQKSKYSAFDRIVVDDRAQEAVFTKKLADPELVAGDLSDLVLGRLRENSASQNRSAFIFRGTALGDIALAALAYRKYRRP